MKYELVTGGFNIKPGVITKRDFQEHKNILLVKPNAHLSIEARTRYGPPERPFPLWRITPGGILLPKYYGLSKFDVKPPDLSISIPEGDSIHLEFNSNLREHQVLAVNKIKESY